MHFVLAIFLEITLINKSHINSCIHTKLEMGEEDILMCLPYCLLIQMFFW